MSLLCYNYGNSLMMGVMFMTDNFCEKTAAIWQVAGYGILALKIVIPIIIIVLGIVDFVKAVMASDDKAINKASMTLIQRFVMGVCIFWVPTIVNILIGLVDDLGDNSASIDVCSTCLLDVNNCNK